MAALPADPAPAANRFGSLVTALLVLALAWVAAKGTWALVAPSREAALPTAAAAATRVACRAMAAWAAPAPENA